MKDFLIDFVLGGILEYWLQLLLAVVLIGPMVAMVVYLAS